MSRRIFLATVAAATVGIAAAQPAAAAVEVPFGARFAASAHGDVTMAANTLMTCPDAGGTETDCLTAREGGAGPSLNNNGYTMELVDVDGDASTFDSSRATLSLPVGATVRFAGLYYGARTSAGTGGAAAPDPAARGTVLFQPPGAPGYSALAATVSDSSGIAASYVGFADVTAAVAAAGAGVYAVANVQAGTGSDRYAGWSLVVAYEDPAAPPRSLRVYDGLASIEAADPPLQIAVGGLETPPSGTVKARLGIIAYEGDRGTSGDRLRLDGQDLADAANPANNTFNSSIAAGGANVPGRTPDYVNQLGFDADLIDANGLLSNDATTATLQESTSIEQYLTQVVTVSIDLDPQALQPPAPPGPVGPTGGGGKGKPDKGAGQAQLKLEVEGPERVRPEQVIAYRITVRSTGKATARRLRICNRLPAPLHRLTAPRARVDGGRACWQVKRLRRGKSLSFSTTARVDVSGRRSLQGTTVLTARNARPRRVTSRLRVVPLAATPCGRLALAATAPVAQASC